MASGTINRDVSGVLSAVKEIKEFKQTGMQGFELHFVNGDMVRMAVGKLDASTNYAQFWVNNYDKGYIRFDTSRNIDNW